MRNYNILLNLLVEKGIYCVKRVVVISNILVAIEVLEHTTHTFYSDTLKAESILVFTKDF